MEKNVDVFIGTQKTFKQIVKNDVYKIVVGNHEIENNSNLELIKCSYDSNLDDRFYSEIYMLRYVANNYNLKDYVGFCHYRKYFSFLDDIPNMDEIFKHVDVITAKPLILKQSIKNHYKNCHNIEDLYIVGGILADKYPEYSKVWSTFINKNIMFPYNMFIMKKEDFIEYITFITNVLDEYVNIVGNDIEKRIENNKEKYLKNIYPNSEIDYQYRIGGYLAERLTNVFIIKKFRKIKAYKVELTEKKYIKNE